MYDIEKYTHSLCATGPTCHTHTKITYMPLSDTDDIQGIFLIVTRFTAHFTLITYQGILDCLKMMLNFHVVRFIDID